MTVDVEKLKEVLARVEASPVECQMGVHKSMPESELWAIGVPLAHSVIALSEENERLTKRLADKLSDGNASLLERATLAETRLSEAVAALKEIVDVAISRHTFINIHDRMRRAEDDLKLIATLARAQGNAEGDGNE